MKLIIILFFCSTNYFCFGQEVYPQKDFSENWKNDSLGDYGYREKCVVWDSTKKIYLINGHNLNGLKLNKVIELLGHPNFYSSWQFSHAVGFFDIHTHKKRQTMNYYLHGDSSLEYFTLIIHKHKVYYLNENYIKKFEGHKLFGKALKD